jgi:hypothetical protein
LWQLPQQSNIYSFIASAIKEEEEEEEEEEEARSRESR